MKTRPAIFLDRDGVINQMISGYPGIKQPKNDVEYDSPRTPADVTLIEGVGEQLARLMPYFPMFIVTNQPGIAYGKIASKVVLDEINQRIANLCAEEGAIFQEFATCLHSTNREKLVRFEYELDCNCRKPKPGMILDLASRHQVDLPNSWLIGDSLSDIDAGLNAVIDNLILIPYLEKPNVFHPQANLFLNMREAVDHILSKKA